MDPASEITRLWQQTPALMLVMCRVGALFFSAPLVGGPFVPMRVKSLLTLTISVIMLPLASPHLPTPLPLDLGFVLLIAQELATGATVGLALTLLFEGARAGGELINRYAGFSAAENFDPEAGTGEGPVGDLMLLAIVLLFLAADMHLYMIAAMARSFEIIPVGAFGMHPQVLALMSHGTGQGMTAACAISFPVLAVVILTTVAEGVITKAVPQINVLFISFAVKIFGSLMVLYGGMPMIVAFMGTCLIGMRGLVDGALLAMRSAT